MRQPYSTPSILADSASFWKIYPSGCHEIASFLLCSRFSDQWAVLVPKLLSDNVNASRWTFPQEHDQWHSRTASRAFSPITPAPGKCIPPGVPGVMRLTLFHSTVLARLRVVQCRNPGSTKLRGRYGKRSCYRLVQTCSVRSMVLNQLEGGVFR